MFFRRGRSIQSKFTFGIAIVITLIMIFFSIITIFYNSKSIEKELESTLGRLSVFSINSLGSALWQYNDDYIENYIESLFLYEDLVFATVITDTGKIGTKTHPDYQHLSHKDFLNKDSFITSEEQVIYKNVNVGRIFLVMSRDRVFDLIFLSSILSVLILLVLNIAIFTSILILNKRYIFTPLTQLEASVKSISSGNFDAEIGVSSKDEIGNLAHAFSQMMQNLKRITASRNELNHEITERKKVEKKLEEYKNSLEIKVKERTLELQNTQEMMLRKEKLATIGRLSGSVAHDIRNPLGVIGNSVYFLKQSLGKASEEKQLEYFNLMEKEINRTNEIITDLMDFSKENKPVFHRADMNRFLKTIVDDFNFPNDVTVELDLHHNLPSPLFDHSQFQRIFLNLIINAVQAMPDGGTLSILSRSDDTSIIVKFQDTGGGIPAEDYNKIFDALYTTKPKGVGLGLSIVSTFIEKHNGRVEVWNNDQNGATFALYLPINQD